MDSMSSRFSNRLYVLGVVIALSISCLAASARDSSWRYRKYKAPPPTANITVTVLRNDSGTPIANAAVIFHPLKNGKDQGGMETKSGQDGKATITVIPIGDTVLVQIIADGYQTYGSVYKIDKAKMAMKIRLKLPQPEYSAYKDHTATADSGQGSGGAGKQVNPPKGQSSSPSKDKPSNSAKDNSSSQAQRDAENGGSQSQTQQR